MSEQTGILSTPEPYHIHIEYRYGDDLDRAYLTGIIQSELESATIRNRKVLFGFSDKLWNALSQQPIPGDYRPFSQIKASQTTVPSTQGDLWVWYQGVSHSWNLDSALVLDSCLRKSGAVRIHEIHGYTRHENRDYTGFIDGTENPVDDAALDAALIPDGQGGSFALTQTWEHNLNAFNSLSVPAQEKVIGRTKSDSVELDEESMPDDSHVSRTDATVDGVKQKIVRRSVPYGDLDTRGLHFVAFACHLDRIQVQLERMYGVSGDGLHDRLTEFSTPVSGSYWYVPGIGALRSLKAT